MKISVIAPTYNEAENIGPFVETVSRALAGLDYEILIVDDDSPDLTWRAANELSKQNPNVRVIRRMRNRGLGRAVVEGFSQARAEVLACLDADLQHDPSILPQMLHELEKGGELVVGSRYMRSGKIEEWNLVRRFVSWIATKAAQICVGVKLDDPMSGYFMLRREDFLAVRDQLNAEGFKILLEIAAELKGGKIVEVPFTFRPRTAGRSKLSVKVVLQYLNQLWRLGSVRSRLGTLCLPAFKGTPQQRTKAAVFGRKSAHHQ
jgi:dolichol-phosphate mannosyltransferase